jgi:hypothetical protein
VLVYALKAPGAAEKAEAIVPALFKKVHPTSISSSSSSSPSPSPSPPSYPL